MNDKPIVTPTEKLAKRKGIKYIPFYTSPCLERENRSRSPEVDFSEKEMNLFTKRYEEGYDLCDERYNLWLQKYYPADVVCKALFKEESEECSVQTASREEPTNGREETAIGRGEPITSKEAPTSGRDEPTTGRKEPETSRKETPRGEEHNTLK